MKQNSIRGRLIEYFTFTYFNWLIVVPFLIPWVLLRLQLDGGQFQIWIGDSILVSLFLGWWTVKMDSKFAPWFYKKMGWKKIDVTKQTQETFDRLVQLGHDGKHCTTNCSYCIEYRLCKRLISGKQRIG